MEIIKDLGIHTNHLGYRFRMVKAKCGCGVVKVLRENAIKSGNTKSCGCGIHRKDIRRICDEQSYGVLKGMKSRCYNPKRDYYSSYGGRGIVVCDEWMDDSWSFVNWANSNGYKKGLYIDRINPNGNYEPSNCRFVDASMSARNTRLLCSSNKSGYRGVTKHTRKGGGTAWRARVGINGKNVSIGVYDSKILAAKAFNSYVIDNKTGHPLNIIN